VAIVMHTMGGSLAGTDSWFRSPSSQVSAHFGVGLDGAVHQYVDLSNTAWANGVLEEGNEWRDLVDACGRRDLVGMNPNQVTVSIETEDLGDRHQLVTPAMVRGVTSAAYMALMRFPTIQVVTGHNVISPRSRAHCPGDRWRRDQYLNLVAGILKLKCW